MSLFVCLVCRTIFHAAVDCGKEDLLKFLLDHASHHGFVHLVNQQEKFVGGDRCFLVRGRDNGLLAFHYIEVDRFHVYKFRELTRSGGSLDVASYGTVIKSGWGAHPAPEIVKEIDDMYDTSRVTSDTPLDMTPLFLAILKVGPKF